ncbi:hypothetical protein VTI74DRAFT_2359 [Chaetomium olivicolor]
MAPCLTNLPIETLTLILSQFCLHCTKAHGYDSPDGYFRSSKSGPPGEQQHPDHPSWYSRNYRMALHSMCLVSRRFRYVAQSVLYHEFVPGYGDAWRSTRFSWDGRLASFVRTLVARPNLAALVERVYVQVYLLGPVTEEEAQAALEAAAGATADDYLACFQGMQNLVNVAGVKLTAVMHSPSARHFRIIALKHVFLSVSMLTNGQGRASYTNYDSVLLTSLLPPSIVSLYLAGDLGKFTPRLGHALRYLAKSVGPRKQFKALKRVRCDAVYARGRLEDMAVGKAFAACGVDFDYCSWPLSEPTLRKGEETPREALSAEPSILSDDDEDL